MESSSVGQAWDMKSLPDPFFKKNKLIYFREIKREKEEQRERERISGRLRAECRA